MTKLNEATMSDINRNFYINKIEKERIIKLFRQLAEQMDVKANEDESEVGLVWTAAASSIRRICDEV